MCDRQQLAETLRNLTYSSYGIKFCIAFRGRTAEPQLGNSLMHCRCERIDGEMRRSGKKVVDLFSTTANVSGDCTVVRQILAVQKPKISFER